MTPFQGSEVSGIWDSEPQKGVKNWLFDQNEGTFTPKKNFFEQLLLNTFFSKTLFSGTYSNKLDHFLAFWALKKISFSKMSPDHSEKNFCFTICNFFCVLSLVNFFLSTLLQGLYLVTQKFFFENTNALLPNLANWL